MQNSTLLPRKRQLFLDSISFLVALSGCLDKDKGGFTYHDLKIISIDDELIDYIIDLAIDIKAGPRLDFEYATLIGDNIMLES